MTQAKGIKRGDTIFWGKNAQQREDSLNRNEKNKVGDYNNIKEYTIELSERFSDGHKEIHIYKKNEIYNNANKIYLHKGQNLFIIFKNGKLSTSLSRENESKNRDRKDNISHDSEDIEYKKYSLTYKFSKNETAPKKNANKKTEKFSYVFKEEKENGICVHGENGITISNIDKKSPKKISDTEVNKNKETKEVKENTDATETTNKSWELWICRALIIFALICAVSAFAFGTYLIILGFLSYFLPPMLLGLAINICAIRVSGVVARHWV